MDLVVEVVEIKGTCPVYKPGDSFTLKAGYQLISDRPICMHGLSALMPFYNALRAAEPKCWGLAGANDEEGAYVQCPDALCRTGGGTAIFRISRAAD